ncbi:MAG: zinc ribbon domain-containing protein [Muribaculaceae bacterium]|nr:zinc ribbon domain-containing protein [Muribaculaceae bacterium]
MALIKCPNCGNNISDKAKMCPHCGSHNSVTTQLSNEYLKFFYLLKSSAWIYLLYCLLWFVSWLINFNSQEAVNDYLLVMTYVTDIAKIVFFLSLCFYHSYNKWINWAIFAIIVMLLIGRHLLPSVNILVYINMVFTVGVLLYYLLIFKNLQLKYITLSFLINYIFNYATNVLSLFYFSDHVLLWCIWASKIFLIIFVILCVILKRKQIAVNPT